MADEAELIRLYGGWRRHQPADAAELMADYPGLWWVAGGWAIQAFTGVAREHADLDLSAPRPDADRLHEHLSRAFDVWLADDGRCGP